MWQRASALKCGSKSNSVTTNSYSYLCLWKLEVSNDNSIYSYSKLYKVVVVVAAAVAVVGAK